MRERLIVQGVVPICHTRSNRRRFPGPAGTGCLSRMSVYGFERSSRCCNVDALQVSVTARVFKSRKHQYLTLAMDCSVSLSMTDAFAIASVFLACRDRSMSVRVKPHFPSPIANICS